MSELSLSFLVLDVRLDDDEYETLENIQETLKRLTQRRKAQISSYEPVGLNSAEFSARLFSEALLYRIVATAGGAIVAWNTGNILCSFMAARGLFETFAVLYDYKKSVAKAVNAGDLHELEVHTTKRIFATRDRETLSSRPEFAATNVATFVKKMSEDLSGATFVKAYDLMSERCHPNSAGTVGMFSKIDLSTGVVSFSDRNNKNFAFRLISQTISTIVPAEIIFDELDDMLAKLGQ